MEKEKNSNYNIGETERRENNTLREEKMVQPKVSTEREIDKTKDEKVIEKQEENERKSLVSDKRERTGREFIRSPLKKEVLATKRPVKVTKGGRRFSFTALLLVKDESKKAVAFANAGGKEMMTAFRKSSHEAQKKLINYFSPQQTIPRDIKIRYRGVTILLKPAPPGTGVKAGSVLNSLFKFLEIKNISATIICSRRKRKNKPVIIRAAFMALDKLTGKRYDY
jgi:small subunit ribosomal protein S5